MNSDIPELVVPKALLEAKHPLGVALSSSLNELVAALAPQENGPSAMRVAWRLRDSLDLITVYLASCATQPLSAADAPLPGWKRNLWRVDFSEAASGLLSWAMAYLPRKSKQNPLAAALLRLLFVTKEDGTPGPTQSFAGLVGVGNTSSSGAGYYTQWREKFFSCRSLEQLTEMSSYVFEIIPELNALLEALAVFMRDFNFETAFRGEQVRVIMRSVSSTRHELLPFLLLRNCSQCHVGYATVHLLAAPLYNGEFLYREVGTPHLITYKFDSALRRRFFSAPPQAEREMMLQSSTSVLAGFVNMAEGIEAEFNRQVVDTSESDRALEQLHTILTEDIYKRFHLPLYALVCEARVPVPFKVLTDPGLGIRDSMAVAGRLHELLTFTEDDSVKAHADFSKAEIEACKPVAMQEAGNRLAFWAKMRLEGSEKDELLRAFAVSGAARWAMSSGNREIIEPLAKEDAVFNCAKASMERMLERGDDSALFSLTRDWIMLLESVPDAPGDRLVRLRLMRATLRRQQEKFVPAREELDKALEAVEPYSEEFQSLKAELLKERATINLYLEKPAKAIEDASEAAKIFEQLYASGEKDICPSWAELSRVRGKALISLGHKNQAASVMESVVTKDYAPESPDDRLIWANLNLDLGELLRDTGSNPKLMAGCYETTLKYIPADKGSRANLLARTKALRGLAECQGLEGENNLREAMSILQPMLERDFALDLQLIYCDVLKALVGCCERAGRSSEALVLVAKACEAYDRLIKKSGDTSYRPVLAGLWQQRARLEESCGTPVAAEAAWWQTLEQYRALKSQAEGSPTGVEFGARCAEILAKLGSMEMGRGQNSQALLHLRQALELWRDPDDLSKSSVSLGILFNNLGQLAEAGCDRDEAIEYYNKAFNVAEAKGDRALRRQALSRRVWLLFEIGRPKEAARDFTALLERTATRSEVNRIMLYRGVAYLRSYQFENALQDFRTVAQMNETPLQAQAGCGLAFVGLRDPQNSVQSFRALLEMAEEAEPKEKSLYGMLAHGGLGAIHNILKSDRQYRDELLLASKALFSSADFSLSDMDDRELAEHLGVFYWEAAGILAQSAQAWVQEGDIARAKNDLTVAQRLLARPGNVDDLPSMRTKVSLPLVGVYRSLGLYDQALKQARFVLDNMEEDSISAQGMADLNYTCAQLGYAQELLPDELIKKYLQAYLDFCGDVIEQEVEEQDSLEDNIVYSSPDEDAQKPRKVISDASRYNACIALIMRADVELRSGDPSKALEYSDRAVNILQAWEAELEEHGGELQNALPDGSTSLKWLLGWALFMRARNFHLLNSLDSAIYDISELTYCMREATAYRSDSFLCVQFLKLFRLYLDHYLLTNGKMCQTLAEVAALPVWSAELCSEFESRFLKVVNASFPEGAWPVLGVLISSYSRFSTAADGNQMPCLGSRLLTAWYDLSLELSDVLGANYPAPLEALCESCDSLGEHPGYPENYALNAMRGLARREALLGHDERAAGLIDRAKRCLPSTFTAATRAVEELALELERAHYMINYANLNWVSKLLEKLQARLLKIGPCEDTPEENRSRYCATLLIQLRQELVDKGWVEPQPEPEEQEKAEEQQEVREQDRLEAPQEQPQFNSDEAAIGAVPELSSAVEVVSSTQTVANVAAALLGTDGAGAALNPPFPLDDMASEPVSPVEAEPEQSEAPSDDSGTYEAMLRYEDGTEEVYDDVQPEAESVPEEVECQPETESVPEEAEYHTEAESVPEEAECQPEAEPVPEEAECQPEAEPVPEEAEYHPEAEPVPEEAEYHPEAEPVPEEAEYHPEAEPVPEEAEYHPEAEPIPEEAECQPEAEPVPEEAEYHPEAEPVPESEVMTPRVAGPQFEPIEGEEEVFSPKMSSHVIIEEDDSAANDGDQSPSAGGMGSVFTPSWRRSSSLFGNNLSESSLTAQDSTDNHSQPIVAKTSGPQFLDDDEVWTPQSKPVAAPEFSEADSQSQASQAEAAPVASPALNAPIIAEAEPVIEAEPVAGEKPVTEAVPVIEEELSAPEDSAAPEAASVPEEPVPPQVAEAQPAPVIESQPQVEEQPGVEKAASWEPQPILDRIEQGFAALDVGNLMMANTIFSEVGYALDGAPGDVVAFEVMPALLEGMNDTVKGMIATSMFNEAWSLAEFAAQLGNSFLAPVFSPDSWPLWGDIEGLAAELSGYMNDIERARAHYRTAQDLFLKLVDQGGDMAFRIDAMNMMIKHAGLLYDCRMLPESEQMYIEATLQGEKLLGLGFQEEITLASLHMALGRVRLAMGNIEKSQINYKRAISLYSKASQNDGNDHIVEIATARAGLAEVLLKLNKIGDAHNTAHYLRSTYEELQGSGRLEEAREVDLLWQNLNRILPPE